MAQLREPEPDTAEIREELAAHLRALLAGRPYMRPAYAPLLERLEAGEPVAVPRWRIARWLPPEVDGERFMLTPDGDVIPVVAVRDGLQITEWETA